MNLWELIRAFCSLILIYMSFNDVLVCAFGFHRRLSNEGERPIKIHLRVPGNLLALGGRPSLFHVRSYTSHRLCRKKTARLRRGAKYSCT